MARRLARTPVLIGGITIRCTRSRGPRGFFCLHDFRRGPVNVAVIQLPDGLELAYLLTIGILLRLFRISRYRVA